MELLFQFQLSVYSLVALIMLTIRIYYKEEVYSYSARLFRILLFNAGVLLILEFLSWAFDGKPGSFNYLLNYSFNFILFVVSTLVASFWLSYVHYKIYGDIKKIRRNIWFLYPALISLLIAIVNVFTPIVFTVNETTNLFERLPFVSINFIMVYALILYSLAIAMKERAKIKPTVLMVVILFILLPAFASLLQLYNYGLIIMYPMVTLSIIVVYLFLETQSASIDYLTGAYSRSRFDEYVENKIDFDEEFSVVMLDLDNFKVFNDKYGHIVGDRILIQYVNVAKQVFGAQSLVSRYGGDEFVVVVPHTNEDKLLSLKEELRKKIRESKDQIFRKVQFSFGYSYRTKVNQYTYEKLLVDCDEDMYKDKAVNKNYKRRKEDRK